MQGNERFVVGLCSFLTDVFSTVCRYPDMAVSYTHLQSLQGTLLYMAVLCHCVLCKDTDQFSAACLLADDGLHDLSLIHI